MKEGEMKKDVNDALGVWNKDAQADVRDIAEGYVRFNELLDWIATNKKLRLVNYSAGQQWAIMDLNTHKVDKYTNFQEAIKGLFEHINGSSNKAIVSEDVPTERPKGFSK